MFQPMHLLSYNVLHIPRNQPDDLIAYAMRAIKRRSDIVAIDDFQADSIVVWCQGYHACTHLATVLINSCTQFDHRFEEYREGAHVTPE